MGFTAINAPGSRYRAIWTTASSGQLRPLIRDYEAGAPDHNAINDLPQPQGFPPLPDDARSNKRKRLPSGQAQDRDCEALPMLYPQRRKAKRTLKYENEQRRMHNAKHWVSFFRRCILEPHIGSVRAQEDGVAAASLDSLELSVLMETAGGNRSGASSDETVPNVKGGDRAEGSDKVKKVDTIQEDHLLEEEAQDLLPAKRYKVAHDPPFTPTTTKTFDATVSPPQLLTPPMSTSSSQRFSFHEGP